MHVLNKIGHWCRRQKQELIAAGIFLLFAFGFNIYRVQGDGGFYYSFLEGMLKIPNPETSSPHPGFMQSGCVFFNAPFYIAAYLIENLFKLRINIPGITLRTASINLASNFYMLMSILLTARLLRRLRFEQISIPILSILFSTSAFVVAVVMPSYNHAVDIFINTLFLSLLLSNEHLSCRKSFMLGVVYVVAMLVRYFNFVWIFPVIMIYFMNKNQRNLIYFLCGALSVAWVFPLILFKFNGGCLSFFGGDKDFGAMVSHMVVPYPKYFFKILLHPLHGILVWSPVLIFSIIGLVSLFKVKKNIALPLLTAFFLAVAINSFTPIWYAGWSFSIRYLAGLFPVYVIGLAAFLQRYGRKFNVIIVVCTLFSIFLFFNWYLCVIHGEFGTPFDMVQAWKTGVSETFAGKKVDAHVFFLKVVDLCRYKYLFRGFR